MEGLADPVITGTTGAEAFRSRVSRHTGLLVGEVDVGMCVRLRGSCVCMVEVMGDKQR